jgi:cell wall-associated NlpC family hydrolase
VAQSHLKDSASENAQLQTVSARARRHDTLSSDDRLSLLAAALDKRVQRRAEPDCSHLVHTVYQAAGLPYKYEPSSYLYAGAENFKRVKSPLPGDIIVWRGHVGIVIEPSQHIFFSYLSSGPGTDNYEAPYWKHRGKPRFYRYVSNHPAASH